MNTLRRNVNRPTSSKTIFVNILFKILILFAGMFFLCREAQSTSQDSTGLKNFITRKKDKLFDGEKEFRFISVNVPNFHIVEDAASSGSPEWHRIMEFEQEDVVKTVSLMGGQVFRMYTFSVVGGMKNSDELSHILGIDPVTDRPVFNESLFRDLDRGIALAGEYGVRVIIPFVDNWEWFGGDKQWAALRKKTEWQFYFDKTCLGDFEYFITWLLNRRNTYTGKLYKDDKTIMCWELGNELFNAPASWLSRVAAHVKKIDKNHLLMDGQYKNVNLREVCINDPNIDILTNHYVHTFANFRQQIKGKKPFILGEFITSSGKIEKLLDSVINNEMAGALIWSLRFHSQSGGFYIHSDFETSDSFQYPGCPEGAPYGEDIILETLRKKAYAIRGLIQPPPHPAPGAPVLLPADGPHNINWLGSAGAMTYTLERALSPDGPWNILAMELSDMVIPLEKSPRLPLFTDPTAVEKGSYYYRIKAINNGGESPYSNIINIKVKAE